MRSRLLVSVAAILSVGTAAACSSILGLNDFKDAPSTGGSGGIGGTAGGGGSGGSGAGGSAGAAGAAGQTWLSCDTTGQPLKVLTPTDLGNGSFESDRIFVASDGGASYVAVIAKDESNDSGATAFTLFVRTLKNEGGQTKGNLVSYAFPTGDFDISTTAVVNGKLHVLGRMNGELGDVSFAIGSGGGSDLSMPANVDPMPAPCTGTANPRDVRFAFDGANWHTAVTCESNEDGGTLRSLYVDGNLVDSGSDPDQSLAVRRFVYVKGTYLLVTGNDFGPPVILRYGTSASDLKAKHEFSLTTEAGKFSALFSVAPRFELDAAVLLGATVSGPLANPQIVPADLWGRIATPTDAPELAQTPAGGFTNLDSFTEALDIAGFGAPAVKQDRIVYAGANPLLRNNVHLMILDGNAKLLYPSTVVYGSTDTNVIAAAAGFLDVGLVVVWGEESKGAYSISGQGYFCHF